MHSPAPPKVRIVPQVSLETFINKMFARTKADIFICSYANIRSEKKKYSAKDIVTRDPKTIAAFIKQYDVPGRACYLTVNTVRRRKKGKDEVAEINALHIDIDFHGIAENEKTILGVLRKLKYPPSVVVHSGHGLHCYWLYDVPLGAEQIASHEALLLRLAKALAGDQNAAEVARVLRSPTSHRQSRYRARQVLMHCCLAV